MSSAFAKNFLRRLTANGFAVAAILKFFFTTSWPQLWIIISSAVIAVLGVTTTVLDYREERKNEPALSAQNSDQKKINFYMARLLRGGGRVAIYSNDLTWVSGDEEIREILCIKAKKGEVTVILPKKNTIALELESAGAQVVDYPELSLTPQLRFTIVHFGTADRYVALGRKIDGRHVIREFGKSDVAFYLAEDIVNVLIQHQSFRERMNVSP